MKDGSFESLSGQDETFVYDWLNCESTNTVRGGNVVRAPVNKRLDVFARLMPRRMNGRPMEYDISYESPPGTIKGYRFSDLLTQAVWMAPTNTPWMLKTMDQVLAKGPTDHGKAIIEQLTQGIEDEYVMPTLMRKPATLPGHGGTLAVLTGSNMLSLGMLDLLKLDKLMEDNDAHVKPHPLTTPLDFHRLGKRYGARRVYPSHGCLYPLMAKYSTIASVSCSESGIMAALQGKSVVDLTTEKPRIVPTYGAIYYALFHAPSELSVAERASALLSHPESGFLTIYHEALLECIAAFEKHYASYPHGVESPLEDNA